MPCGTGSRCLHESSGGIHLAKEVRGCFPRRAWLHADLKDQGAALAKRGWKRFPGRGQGRREDPAVVGDRGAGTVEEVGGNAGEGWGGGAVGGGQKGLWGLAEDLSSVS